MLSGMSAHSVIKKTFRKSSIFRANKKPDGTRAAGRFGVFERYCFDLSFRGARNPDCTCGQLWQSLELCQSSQPPDSAFLCRNDKSGFWHFERYYFGGAVFWPSANRVANASPIRPAGGNSSRVQNARQWQWTVGFVFGTYPVPVVDLCRAFDVI